VVPGQRLPVHLLTKHRICLPVHLVTQSTEYGCPFILLHKVQNMAAR
jgi:hypothetical protein